MTLAENVRSLRAKAGLSQYDLAKRTQGVTPATISRIESGLIENPQRDTLVQLADALSVSIGELLGEVQEQQEEVPLEELVRRVIREELPGENTEELIGDFLIYVSLSAEQRRQARQFARYLRDQMLRGQDSAKGTEGAG